jgi:hypothetical protein
MQESGGGLAARGYPRSARDAVAIAPIGSAAKPAFGAQPTRTPGAGYAVST